MIRDLDVRLNESMPGWRRGINLAMELRRGGKKVGPVTRGATTPSATFVGCLIILAAKGGRSLSMEGRKECSKGSRSPIALVSRLLVIVATPWQHLGSRTRQVGAARPGMQMQVAGRAIERQKKARAGVADSKLIAVVDSCATVGVQLGGQFRQVEVNVIRRWRASGAKRRSNNLSGP
ncbi:hypothetical protein DL95DRAFT_68268 [Leptodontidium sp. 2 PMI_412]|nr:hypothetical protein DL95DRAFT_68268 [Leptodontidium sp. 2 PMI_412]